jgi:predicted nucleic acid-binding protein
VSVRRALLDTSVLISADPAIATAAPAAAISVISIGELHAGVLRAPTPSTRAARAARLEAIRSAYLPLPVDDAVADEYGRALATARDEGRIEKATDLLIIATAAATRRSLVTLDERQARLAHRLGLEVVPVS